MNTKILPGAGCLLLLIVAMTPGAVGHDERQAFDPTVAGGVSGAYYGAAGPAIVDEDAPLGQSTYQDTISAGSILCDVEVAGDGTAPFPQDEANVDGSAGGLVPDTNDDGGQGGACHVRTYLHTPYNTPGCQAVDAHAINQATGTFIGASCDWKTVEGGTPSSDIFLTCVINSILQGQPLNIVSCLTAFLACLGNPTGCTEDGTESCGSDGVSDGINYGHGGQGVAFPTAFADQGDVATGPCLQSDATAQVFVFDAVITETSNHPAGTLPHVHLAGTGQIWSDAMPVCSGPMGNLNGPTFPLAKTWVCYAACTAEAYNTYADKNTGPAVGGQVTTTIIDCANGAASDAENNVEVISPPKGVETGAWPAAATGYYVCIVNVPAGVTGEGQCKATTIVAGTLAAHG